MWAAPSATRRSSSWRRAPCWAPGERRTENGERNAPAGRRARRWEDVEGLRCAAITKNTKDHEGAQRTARMIGNHKGHEGHKGRETQISQIWADFWRAGARRLSRMKRSWDWRVWGAAPRPGRGRALSRHFTVPKKLERRLSAKRRAAGAVSGGAAERPMEPEAIRASPCVFAENLTEGHWDAPTGDAGDSGAPLRGDGETP